MTVGVPSYVSLSSSGSSPWQMVDDFRNPVNIAIQVVRTTINSSASGTYQIDVTLDDPQGYAPNPILNSLSRPPGQSFAASVTVMPSTAVGGPTPNSSANTLSLITAPIKAWRLTQNSTSDVTVATAIQSGPR